MKYRLLGNSGLRVSEAALGTMTFGDDWGWGVAKDEARKVYDAFRSLSADQLKALDDASRIELDFPHDLYAKEMVRAIAYGRLRDRIISNNF